MVASGLAVELPTDDDVMSSALLVRDCWCVTSLGVASPVRRVSPCVFADGDVCGDVALCHGWHNGPRGPDFRF